MKYECNINELAKYILSNMTETPYNKELMESWRYVAVESNPSALYNTVEAIKIIED